MILHIQGKVSDMFSFTMERKGHQMMEYGGYVPGTLGIGKGDYVSMSIDTETGQIVNWKPINIVSLIEECSQLAAD